MLSTRKSQTGQELLEDVSYDVECVWDDWYNLSYVVVGSYPNNSHASINDLMTLIADISGEVIKIAQCKFHPITNYLELLFRY